MRNIFFNVLADTQDFFHGDQEFSSTRNLKKFEYFDRFDLKTFCKMICPQLNIFSKIAIFDKIVHVSIMIFEILYVF